MATVALTIVGNLIAPGVGGAIGAALGSYLDDAFILPAVFGQDDNDVQVEGGRLNSLQLQQDSEGAPINYVRGSEMRLAGTVIWMTDLKETRTVTQSSPGGGGGGKGKDAPSASQVTYSYSVSCAIGVAAGPIKKIRKIWANTFLVFQEGVTTPVDARVGSLTTYVGSQTQVADPVIDAVETDVPAFRDLAYVVIEDLQLADFGNRLPNFTFLVEADGGEPTVLAYWPFDDSIGAIASGSATRPAEASGLVDDGNKAAAANVAIFASGKFGNYLGALGAGGITLPRDTALGLDPKDDVAQCEGIAFDFWWKAPFPEFGSVGLKLSVQTQAGVDLVVWETGLANGGTPNFPLQKVTVKTIGADIVTPTPFATALDTLGTTWFHTRILIMRENPARVFLTAGGASQREATGVVGDTPTLFQENDVVVKIEDVGASDTAQFDELAVLTGCVVNPRDVFRPDLWLQGDWTSDSGFGYRLSSLCRAIIERSSLISSGEIDVAGVQGCVRGYIARRPMSVGRQIEPVLGAYDVAVKESAGKLVLFTKSTTCGEGGDAASVPQSALAAHERGTEARSRIARVTDRADFAMPKEVNVEFMEPANDYQAASQRERATMTTSDVVKNVRFPLVFSVDEGRRVAERFLWRAWAERRTIEFTLPPSFADLEETDLLTVPTDIDTYSVRVTEINRGANGLVQIRGTIEDKASLRDEVASESLASLFARGVLTPPGMTLHVLDLPPLRDADASAPGYYTVAAVTDPTESFIGGSVVVSDDDVAFTQIGPVVDEGSMGTADTILADGPTTIIDAGNTVDVTLVEGALSSISDAELLAGGNRALLGNEIIGFGVATLTGALKYTLSRLVRGVRNTENETASHGAGERFVVLEAGPLSFVKMNVSGLGDTKFWRAPSTYQPIADAAPSVSLAIAGRSVTPFGPAHVLGSRDASNNLAVTWQRRSRGVGKLFTTSALPAFEAEERYEFDVLDAPGGSVLRTFSIKVTTGTRSFVYPAALQAADGLTPGDPIDLVAYQIGSIVGRGNPTVAVV